MAGVALGFSVHTGWAAMVAVASGAVADRRRVVLIGGDDPQRPRFVYHAASKLSLEAARRLVAQSEELAFANALEALRAASAGRDMVACGIVGGDRSVSTPLESVLASHPLIHTKEGELFRSAVRRASDALGIATVHVRPRELHARGAAALGISPARLDEHLAAVGRTAGPPWAKDQRDAYLAAAVALSSRASPQRAPRR